MKWLHHQAFTTQREGEPMREDETVDYSSIAARYDPVFQQIRKALQRWNVRNMASDDQDAYERETVLLLKHLPTLRQVKDVRSLLNQLLADHDYDASPDAAATQAVNLDLLADEVWYLWNRYHEIRDFLL